ncbi:MAG: 50S ribosomal protein L34e [Candidatus Bathycorpusculaceae bacterium]
MPKPYQQTRTKKRVYKSLPGGSRKLHFKQKPNASPCCSSCGRPLSGIPRITTSEMRKLNRSKRRVWRPFGGQICHNCLKNALKQAARAI